MKIKKLLSFMLAGAMMISMSACGDKDKEESINDIYTEESKEENTYDTYTKESNDELLLEDAYENAKIIYNATLEFAEKCGAYNKQLAADENVRTSMLIVDTSDKKDAKAENITNASKGSNKLGQGAETELSKVVNSALDKDANGSCYIIVFNSYGYPKTVYWASDKKTQFVGSYPPPDDVVKTSKGIESIDKNGEEAFGDIIIS